MAKKIKLEDPIPLKGVLEQLFKSYEVDGKMDDYKIMLAWHDYLTSALDSKHAELLKSNTSAHRITKERHLMIAVKAAVIANELQFMKAMLEEGFKEHIKALGYKSIKKIVFALATLSI